MLRVCKSFDVWPLLFIDRLSRGYAWLDQGHRDEDSGFQRPCQGNAVFLLNTENNLPVLRRLFFSPPWEDILSFPLTFIISGKSV